MAALGAHAASLVVAVDVEAEAQSINSLIVGALGGVAVTVTRLALKLVIRSVSKYLKLNKIFFVFTLILDLLHFFCVNPSWHSSQFWPWVRC